MSDQINKFKDAMRDAGCAPDASVAIEADDKMRYYQLEGDKPSIKKGSYVLRVDNDGFAVGGFMSQREGLWHTWHSKSTRKASEEEKAAWQQKRDEAKAAADEAARHLRIKAADVSAQMWADASADATAGHGYVTRKAMLGDGLRVWTDLDRFEDCLLVPVMRGPDMVGMQKIYADGEKLFVYGSDMRGGHYWLGSPDGAAVVAIGEGVATCDTVRQATGWPVCVAFNAGNLKEVCQSVARSYPGARIVVIADNDLWTWDNKARKNKPDVLPAKDAPEWAEWRANGWLRNVGREAAEQAAAGIGGAQVLYPEAGGDWNDYASVSGLDAVTAQLVAPVEAVAETWEPDYEPDDIGPSWDDVAHPLEKLKEQCGPMGFDEDVYFFLPRTKGQVLELTASALGSMQNLYQLANGDDYQRIMGWDKLDTKEAVAAIGPMLMDVCHKIGPYENGRVYGAGAWVVDKRQYINTGSGVYDVNGKKELQHREVDIDGEFVREARAFYLDCTALTNKDANKLVRICQMLKWRRQISGTLLAGWLVVAVVGGALRWRPHIFITGPKGAGKSTVIEEIVEVVIGDSMIRQDGGSTEAGLRKEVKNSSRPIVMDEFEGESKRAYEEVQKILFWARKASSGGYIVNANRKYRAKSCVCFAAINPLVTQGADADRITLLELEVNKDADAEAHFDNLMDMVHETLTPEYARRLVRRTIDNLDALLHNCEVFSRHAARILKSKRDGDQFGPMLAGAYMLHATGRVTDETAAEYCARQDWSWVHDQKDGTDSERLIRRILNSMIEYSMVDRTVKMPVSEMITRVRSGDPGAGDAAKALARCGMAVKDDWLCVANTDDGLSGLLAGTPWMAYRPSLSRLEGVTTEDKTMRFGGGSPRRFMRVPLAGLIDGVVVEEELPFMADMEGFE